MENSLFETYNNSAIPNSKNIFKTESDMAIEKICAYPSSNFALPHWKCVLFCCAKFPRIDLLSLKLYQHNSHVSPTICFHVYKQIAHCTVHGRLPFNDNKKFQFCETSSYSIITTNIYLRKEIWLPSAVLHTCNE